MPASHVLRIVERSGYLQNGFGHVQTFVLLVLLSIPQNGLSSENFLSDKTLDSAIVLDFEILGETSIESFKVKDQLLIKTFSEEFRRQLKQQSIFDVIDDKQSLEILKKESQHQYLHRCNGCELDLAKQLGADIVVVPWVFRMSVLVQTMHIEIREVKTARLIMKKPYDFRGNSDKAWARVIRYAIRDLKAFAKDLKGP